MTRLYKWFDRRLKDRKIFWFLSVAAIALAYLIIFRGVIAEFDNVLLQEKIHDIERDVNIIANNIKYDAENMTPEEWEANRAFLDGKVALGIGEIDKEYAILARLYKGEGFEEVSIPHNTFDEPFDPFAYPDFVEEVKSRFDTRGSNAYTVTWYGAGDGGHELHLRYRWVPVIEHVEDPYLIIIGVSKYSVQTDVQTWLELAIVLFGVFICAAAYVLIGYVIHIIGRRKETVNCSV